MNKTSCHLIPVILCGGSGSRLWPVSRAQHPKPFIRFKGNKSFLQQAFIRASQLPGTEKIITVTNRDLYFKTRDDFSELEPEVSSKIKTDFILEPFGRNTAPAITLATLRAVEAHGPNATLLILSADHVINNREAFERAVQKAKELAQKGKIVTFGIQPDSPETGYGYIEADGSDVLRFVEKPNLETATSYIKDGRFYWNSGMFCFSAQTMLNELKTHCPDVFEHCEMAFKNARSSNDECFHSIEIGSHDFENVPDDSIDYKVMEKTCNAAVVVCDIGWSDIGCWRSLGKLLPEDSNGNRAGENNILKDSNNCLVYSDSGDGRMISAIGVKDLLIIDTPDALLVADQTHSQNVKNIYSELKSRDHETHKLHKTVHRPWGSYTVLEEGDHFKIKRIEVKPGGRLSLQMHDHRSEHWVVIHGKATVTNNDQVLCLNPNESTYIPSGYKHRLENQSSNDILVIIEIQTGHYLDESDIIRFDDIYGRAL